jgi:hypothetical protein
VWCRVECYMKVACYFNEAERLQRVLPLEVRIAKNCSFSFMKYEEKKGMNVWKYREVLIRESLMSNTSCTSSYRDVPRHTGL